MNPQAQLSALEEVIAEILASIQEVVQSGEQISDEVQGMIADQLEIATQRIQELKEEVQQAQQPVSQSKTALHPDFQLLWILAGQQEQPFISYLREFTSTSTQRLLNNPIALSQTIDQLNQMMPKGVQPFINGIQHADLNSSNIWGTAYDEKTGKMKVRFQSGSVYEYDGIPTNIYRAFVKGNATAKTDGKNQYGAWWVGKNPSLGAALNQYIKAGKFPYRKLR